MRVRLRFREVTTLVLLGVTMMIAGSCQRSIFRQYEYEEEIYLKLDGSATVMINSSIAALIALRGLDENPDPAARPDREKIRAFYASPAVEVTRVSPPWRRHGRRFVQVRLNVPDIRQLAKSAPLAWSRYQFSTNGQEYHYRQIWGASAGKTVSNVNWDGTEIVAVRMHLPSKIEHHNATSKKIDRGNIVAWEQPLKDRLAGNPLEMEVRMQTESILYRTLTIFGLALAAAVVLMGGIVMWVKKKGAPAA
jgi:hypothetical protein